MKQEKNEKRNKVEASTIALIDEHKKLAALLEEKKLYISDVQEEIEHLQAAMESLDRAIDELSPIA